MLQEVSAQVRDGDRAGQVFTVKWDVPESVSEAIERWGEEIVYSHMKGSVIISLQSAMRGAIKKDGATAESVQAAADKYQPRPARGPGKPMSEKASEWLKSLSPEERAEFLSQYLE